MNVYLKRKENGTTDLLAIEGDEKLSAVADGQMTRVTRSKDNNNRETASSYIKAGFDVITADEFMDELDEIGKTLAMPFLRNTKMDESAI